MMKAGAGKDEILAETGHVLGVNNASFEVEEGEVFVVMGLSGSGKSTLIRCLNRLHEPTAGHIYLDGEDILKANKHELEQIRRTKMAMVFQHFGLFPHRTVGDNVAYGLKVRNMSPVERRQKAEEALALVGLTEWIDHYPQNLSGGMQQRVGLARALATDADILLMDEAFSALDPLIRRQMQDELMQLQERLHKTIIFITHDLNEALRIGNRVAVMRDGEIVQIGTPTEIITQPSEDYVAKFMADVDQSRVLSAEFVMKPTHRTHRGDPVEKVLERMTRYKVDTLYVVDDQERTEGFVRRRDLEAIHQNGGGPLRKAIKADFPKTARFTPLNELYGLYESGIPVAVIGDTGKLLGVVYPLDLLATLAAAEEVAIS